MPRTAGRATLVVSSCLLGGCALGAFDWQDRTSSPLHQYKAEFARDVGERFDRSASTDELLSLARHGRVLWLGDHHRDRILHSFQLDLLQRLFDSGTPLALALEAVGTQDQPAVDGYLRGRGTIDDLAATIRARWPESWLDSPEVDAGYYRTLLLAARRHGCPVFALEPTPRLPLQQRDDAIADRIRAAAAQHPHRLIVVVVGQAHLLGQGDLVRRTALPGPVLGADPPPGLRRSARDQAADLVRTDAGVWFFGLLLD